MRLSYYLALPNSYYYILARSDCLLLLHRLSAGSSHTLPQTLSKAAAHQRIHGLEQALATAQTKTTATYRLVEESLAEASDGVLLVNDTRRVRLVNAALYILFGLDQTPADWVGQPATLVEA